MFNGKAAIVFLIGGLIKKDIVLLSEYIPEPESSGGGVEVELYLSNQATKAELKNVLKNVDVANLKSDVNKSDIDKLRNLPSNSSNLKSKVDKLDADKLIPVPVDLNKLGDVVKSDVVKKDAYNAKIKNIDNKIPDNTNIANNTSLNAKIN